MSILTEHIIDSVDSRIAGKDPVVSKKVFTTQDHSTPNYVWNSDFWASDINRDAVSPWNSSGGARKAGVLISPYHYICAKHYAIGAGSTLRFVKSDGTIIERIVLGSKSTADNPDVSQDPIPDINVGVLDQPIFDIDPIEIVPLELNDELSYQNVPALWFDQEEKGLIANVRDMYDYYTLLRLAAPPSTSERYGYFETAISGDSGSPIFFIAQNKLVLLGVMTFGGDGSCSSLNYYRQQTQTLMDSLSTQFNIPQYPLLVADFSNIGHVDSSPTILNINPIEMDQGSNISVPIPVSSGNAPLTFSLENQPSWSTINSSTGVIQLNSPTVGSYSFTVKVVDVDGDFDTAVVSVTVNERVNLVPVITDWIDSYAVAVNTPFTITFTASNGNAPLTWSMTGNPSWVKIDNSGRISYTGNPKNNRYSGTYNINVIVTDVDGDSDSKPLILVVGDGSSGGDTNPGKGKKK